MLHGAASCPQLDLLRVDGSLFFGAVEHVQDELEAARAECPTARHVLLVCSGVNFIDVSGCDFLVNAARRLRDHGVTLYLCNLKPGVLQTLEQGGFVDAFGSAAIFATKARALETIYPRLDVSVCTTCEVRAFIECQHALPNGTPRAVRLS
jgi:sulfate permease, SulP family